MRLGRNAIVGSTMLCFTLALVGTSNAMASSSIKQEIVVTDGTEAKVVLSKPAKTFVCLDPSSIEMLKDLGETNIAYESDLKSFVQMVFGSSASQLKMIGGSWMQPNVEDIFADHPDLVIGDAYPHAQLKPALKGVAPMYLISRSGGYRQSMKDFINLGILTGHQVKAKQEVNQFMNALHQAEKQSPHNQTSLIIWGSSPTDFQVPTVDDPSASVLADISRYPWGGHGAHGMSISLEQILKVNPDVIFVESFTKLDGGSSNISLSQQLSSNPLWKQLKAVKDNRVYEVNVNVWHDDRGGLGLEKILHQAMPKLYPALFAKQ